VFRYYHFLSSLALEKNQYTHQQHQPTAPNQLHVLHDNLALLAFPILPNAIKHHTRLVIHTSKPLLGLL
jgi:hypothetical protein